MSSTSRPDNVATGARECNAGDYFSDELIETNLVFNDVPMPPTAAMITSAIPHAIRQYSIAVAPRSSVQKRFIIVIMGGTLNAAEEEIVNPLARFADGDIISSMNARAPHAKN